MKENKIDVAILGCTGAVGQKLVSLLGDHPLFNIRELVASDRSAGQRYSDRVVWKEPARIPEGVGDIVIRRLSDKLDEVAAMKIRPQDKIIKLIYTHLSMIRETVVRNGNLRAEFFRNIWMVEKVRKNFDEDEIELFRKVYAEGKADGEFDIEDVDLVADITHYCIKGLEVPFIYGRLGHGMTEEASKPLVAKVVYGALGKNTAK